MMLACALLSIATARVEAIAFTALGSRPALRVRVSGRPGATALRQEGEATRLVIAEAALGQRFGGAHRASWSATGRATPAWLVGARPGGPQRIDIGEGAGLVYVVLHAPRRTAPELRRDLQGLLVVLGRPLLGDGRLALALEPAPGGTDAPAADSSASREAAHGATTPPLTVREPAGAPVEPEGRENASVAELYPQLFPPAAGSDLPPAPDAAPRRTEATTFGPVRVHAAVETRYVDADAYLESPAHPVHDRYAELNPQADLKLPLGSGELRAEYRPVFRAFADHGEINSSSHPLQASLQLPLHDRFRLRLRDRFVIGTLDTRVVDPGGEYFFGLGRFRRNDADLAVSVLVAPRTSLELAGALGSVHFLEQSSFFDNASRRGALGVGFEITPTLKAVASYLYDAVPRPDAHPEAESQAHSAELSLSGELLPLLNGDLSLGYRRQQNPQAGPGGRLYSGLTFSGTLTRQLTPESTLSLYLTRALPASAYQANGFYVWTSLQAALQVPLPFALQLRFGVGQQWNDYRAVEPGAVAREDRVLSWYGALRRALSDRLALAASYRSESRRSTVPGFASESNGLLLQLEWQAKGGAER